MSDNLPTVIVSTDPEVGRRASEVMRLLRPMTPRGLTKKRVGVAEDGGYIIIDKIAPSSVVYSLGVGGDVSFDLALAQKGHVIYQYDHTVVEPPIYHPRFIFHRAAIDTDKGRLSSYIEENGHISRNDLILSMDIEGDELNVVPDFPDFVLPRFSQITMELHCVVRIGEDDIYRKVVNVLEKLSATHQIVHVHANNWGWYGLLGGVPMPDTWELTLLRRDMCEFDICQEVFPTSLDRSCNPSAPDYFLGRIGLAP